MNRRWLRRLRDSPESGRKLLRRFSKLHLEDWVRPDPSRRRSKPKKHAPGEAFVDDRGLPRRVASHAKAGVVRVWRRSRKRLWQLLKWLTAWRLRPLKKVPAIGVARGFVVLDHKPYRPDFFAIRRQTRLARNQVARLYGTKDPIIVGPWISEIGFELLYWIPFLNWATAYGKLGTDRLWILSRGGTATWYRHLTPNYLEIFDHVGPGEFRARNEARMSQQGGLKQHGLSELDQELIGVAEQRIGAYRHHVLHPSLMYQLYRPYFLKSSPPRLIEEFALYRRIFAGRDENPPDWLPDDYVAVKLYGNLALRDSEATRSMIRHLLRTLASETEVVILDTGFRYDDHSDLPAESLDRIHDLRGRSEPHNNLDVQTRVIRNARAFYCTYGGFSYLAPLCGVPTVTFYSEPNAFKVEHLELAQRVFRRLDCPPFTVLDIRHLSALEPCLRFLRD